MRKYGGLSSRTPFSKEIGIRLLIGLLFHMAGLNDLSLAPLVSLSADHYIRVWTWLSGNRKQSNSEVRQMGFFRFCRSCMQTERISILDLNKSPELHHQVQSCDGPVTVIGPLWIGQLFDEGTLCRMRSLLSHHDSLDKRVWKLLDAMIEECQLTDRPYIDLHALCDAYRLVPPPIHDVRQILGETGYRVAGTHFSSTSIRTDAAVRDVVGAIRHARGGS
jgi:tRNA (guanine26-N2/guanine27-N2)-dimethyltransferase